MAPISSAGILMNHGARGYRYADAIRSDDDRRRFAAIGEMVVREKAKTLLSLAIEGVTLMNAPAASIKRIARAQKRRGL